MKSFMYLCFVGMLSFVKLQNSFAQQPTSHNSQNRLTTDSWQVGLKEGYSRGNLAKHRNGLHLHTGYCVANNLILGLGASWSKEWFADFSFNQVTVGPFARYQFLTTRLSPFIEVSYQFGKRIDWETRSIRSTFINPGLSIRLFNQLRADVSYGLQFTHRDPIGHAQIGLNYLFSRK